jgi:hypothetical protein
MAPFCPFCTLRNRRMIASSVRELLRLRTAEDSGLREPKVETDPFLQMRSGEAPSVTDPSRRTVRRNSTVSRNPECWETWRLAQRRRRCSGGREPRVDVMEFVSRSNSSTSSWPLVGSDGCRPGNKRGCDQAGQGATPIAVETWWTKPHDQDHRRP